MSSNIASTQLGGDIIQTLPCVPSFLNRDQKAFQEYNSFFKVFLYKNTVAAATQTQSGKKAYQCTSQKCVYTILNYLTIFSKCFITVPSRINVKNKKCYIKAFQYAKLILKN